MINNADVYVTAANPSPGQQLSQSYTVQRTGEVVVYGAYSTAGVGVNVYLAGGAGPQGRIPIFTQPSVAGVSGAFAFQTSTLDVLLAANPSRVSFSIFNGSAETYLVCLGSGASSQTFDFLLPAQSYYESLFPCYSGIVTGIGTGSSGQGFIRVKEFIS
jgi:hypothetical protein